MRFEVDGTEYRLRFKYIHYGRYPVAHYSKWWNIRRLLSDLTVCYIEQRFGHYGVWTPVGNGYSRCAVGDVYNTEHGRVLSLKRAVLSWAKDSDERRAAFSAYFNRNKRDKRAIWM